MKVHIALVNPPSPSIASESFFMPLGIGYLAAVLENNGYIVDIIDCQALNLTRRELRSEFSRLQPDVVGVTSATFTYESALEIVKTAKETCPNCLTVVGGPHVTVMDEQTLVEHAEADIVVRGEGEQTMLELANLISASDLKNLDDVAGITFRKNGQIFQTPNRPFIQNIDELPYPALHYFPLSKYKVLGKTYLPIITSRGCPFQCTFCLVSRICGRRFRARSSRNVIEELEWLSGKYGADAFSFLDDTFTFDIRRASEICEAIKNRNFEVHWDCRTRVDRITKEVLVKMRAANCQCIHFGVESGSQKMLDAMKKGTTVEQNKRAIKWAKEVGISVAISVVVGYPGETTDMLKQTMAFIRKTEPDYVYVCIAIPYPGTEFYSLLRNLGWEMTMEWNHYDGLTHVFKNPLLPAEKIDEITRTFYNNFFSPSYILRKSLKSDFYSQVMARTALNHLLRRIKLPLGFLPTRRN